MRMTANPMHAPTTAILLGALAATLGVACSDANQTRSPNGGSGGGSGGRSAAGGTAGRGSGGINATGGRSATGGAIATGGSGTGGAVATGGATASGGAPATGGASATGGVRATGGNSIAGGSLGTGGRTGMGGSSATAGTGGVPDGGADGGTADAAPTSPYTVTSPDGRISAELTATGAVLRYRIIVDGKQVLAPSEVGLKTNGVELGKNVTLGTPVHDSVDEQYPFFGARGTAVNRANRAAVPVTAGSEAYSVELHVADDGVGVRVRLPGKTGRKIEAERSVWRFDGNPTVWASQLDVAYEQHYRTKTLGTLGTSSYGMPLTAKVDSLYVSITEASMKDYGDMALKVGANGALEGYLHADPTGWTTNAAVDQPWRVTHIARDLTELVNSTLVPNLNSPRDASLAGADWIKPGRSTWQWMAIGAPLATDQHQWVDWTQQLGFEYYLVDDGWKAWPDAWNTLKSVATYAAGKGVKVWLWVHTNEVREATARQNYFKQAADAGIVGVKIDFPPACDRALSNWYVDVARDAAKVKLLVNVHGANKPTGIERTWPNMLTREAIRGHEYQMTRYSRVLESPHDTILPFTRLVGGPGDYTPTVFAAQELQGNTWAHELAQGIVFTSPFLCFSGHPKDYVANPAADVLKAIPAVWDETLVLPGSEPGKVAAFARRSGSSWFVGILNGADAVTMNLSLGFLGTGSWQAIRLGDVTGKGDAWDRQAGAVTATDSISVKLSSRGGFVAWFKP